MSASADRNLLFGILAVQLDFVTKDALVGAMGAWVLDKSKPLGDVLHEQGHLSAERLNLLTALVAEHLKQHADDPQKSLAALSSVDVPAGAILKLVSDPDVRASLAAAGSGRRDPRSTGDLPVASASRYDILRPHAKGGLGEVFVAEDQELHREVALKEIQQQHADDPDSRARFVLEAEVTGGLEHPGVVPVYGLGTYADGRPFYAMRFVRGDNLQQAIRRFHETGSGRASAGNAPVPLPAPTRPGSRRRFDSLEFRQLLRRFTDVCNAVAYAHSRGVLHRDLKPGNVMLGKYGETLVVDWGLAKVTGRAVSGDDRGDDEQTLRPHSGDQSSATVLGRALGTPAYMSPEQAAGRWDDLGPATDVYSLGATLYELLTGRVPFPETDLDAVQKGLFPPPRQVNPAVPPALAAVCHKSMALHPRDRYATPLALAAEVEHWMADEPVSAYPDPWHVRALRWGRRHRAAVAGAAAILLAAVVGLAVLNVHTERARQAVEFERAQTAAERDAKEEERKRAVTARNRTREALDAMTSEVTGNSLATQKALSAEQRKFLESVMTYYEEFAAEPGEDHEGQERLAKAHISLGMIRYRLGQAEEGARLFRRSAERYGRLAADHPGVPGYRRALATSHTSLGISLRGLGKRAEAEAAYRTALAVQEALARDHPGVPDYRSDLAWSHNNLGNLLRGLGMRAEAEAAHRAALAVRKALARDHPGVPDYRRELAASHTNLANLLANLGKWEEAQEVIRAALAVQEALARDHPDVPDYRRDLARSHHNLGHVLDDLGRRAEAAAAFRAALAVQGALSRDHPGVPDYRSDLALSHYNLGNLLRDDSQWDNAEAAYRGALAMQEALARELASVPDYRQDLAASHNSLGNLLADRGRRAEAEAAYRAALAVQEALARDHPGVPNYRRDLAGTHHNLGNLLAGSGKLAEAEAASRQAVALRERLTADFPTVAAYRQELTLSRISVAAHLARAGEHAKAAAEADALAVDADATAITLYDLACVLALASTAPSVDRALADDYAKRAIGLLRRAVGKGYADIPHLLKDPDLDPIRRRPDFADLLWDLADSPAPAQPTAP